MHERLDGLARSPDRSSHSSAIDVDGILVEHVTMTLMVERIDSVDLTVIVRATNRCR